MAGGRLKIEVLPAGSVVPAFQLLEAVARGTLDGGHGVVAYHYGKNSALALWGSGPAFGMDPNTVLAWHYYGGGKDQRGLKYRTVGLAVDVFTELGAAVNPLPGGEIVPAPDRSLIDAVEFNNASSDRLLGFPDVVKNCMRRASTSPASSSKSSSTAQSTTPSAANSRRSSTTLSRPPAPT